MTDKGERKTREIPCVENLFFKPGTVSRGWSGGKLKGMPFF